MILDIWASFLTLPLWVRLWMGFILVPINLVSLKFVGTHPHATWIAVLCIMGMLANVPILLRQREFSSALALPHLIFWTPLIVGILVTPTIWQQPMSSFAKFLLVLLVVNGISLAFDTLEAAKWLRARRGGRA
ncbi:hypothetical protein [Shimia marina]|uniref:Uncharacterized protein n=1 Tax=Shimia marina TaxID=321267 RepID=A0A0P1EJ89_9RHOB|nr:hypothetical protein [Shimia marina]CUH50594.1 hypothetical protein SHM7688_00021 [Shimia marina]SFE39454.1 hypothetical protein SAMN04488037_108173 [Shimia marina]